MPPEKPRSLSAFLSVIVRNLSLDRYRKNRSQKRFSGMEIMLSELQECVPDIDGGENVADDTEIKLIINDWLRKLDYDDRKLFMRRYFYGLTVKELSKELMMPEKYVSRKLFKLRGNLRAYLQEEGITI
jgi:RNA polymerase sigma-70 factor (ECF subfamily)